MLAEHRDSPEVAVCAGAPVSRTAHRAPLSKSTSSSALGLSLRDPGVPAAVPVFCQARSSRGRSKRPSAQPIGTRMVILRSPRTCRGGVGGGWRRIGLSRLPAEGTEEKEPDADDQDRKGEESDDTGIGAQFRSHHSANWPLRLALRKTTRITCPRNRLYTAASITTKIEIHS